jgi:hypothetical protein
MLKLTLIAASLAAFGASPAALAQSTSSQVRASQQHHTQASASARSSTMAFQELQRAAQRLRDSIQVMAQMAPGSQRDFAIRSAHEALFDANQAMLRLPVEYRGSAFTWSQSQSAQARAPAGQTPEEAMRQLQKASDRLYNAVHAMARDSGGGQRAQAIKEANEALVETHAAMAWVYDQQLVGSSGQQSPQSASSTAAGASASVDARGTASSRAGGAVAGGTDATSARGSASAIAGGVGINARVKLSDQARAEHNVKMVFALSTGNYVADVGVTVKDKSGRTVIDGVAHGPWLYAQLPAGSYTASATYNGQTVTEQFDVGRSGQRTAIFRWPASAAHAASGVSPILGTGPQNQPPAVGR